MKKKYQTLLWQFQKLDIVQKNGQNTEGSLRTHFIIGTMHTKDSRVFQHMENNYDKILKCEIFATEFPLDDAENIDVQQYMMLPDGITLTSILTPNLHKKTTTFFKKKLGLDLAQFERYSPFFLTNILSENALNADNFLSLDEKMWQFAKNEGKILRGLETLDEQLDVLKKMPLSDHIKGLKDIVSKHSAFRRKLQKMVKLYEKQDIVALYQLSKKTSQANRELMLFDRNVLMTERILALTQENSLCAAVGAGHLYGKKGILNLLQKSGFTVKPIHQTPY
jgi:uncharacterized protein